MRNQIYPKHISCAAAFLLACVLSSTQAQTNAQQNGTQDTAAAQTVQAPNLQAELGLTPDQIQKWRALNQELRPQEVDGTLKVRQAKQAMADAMESPNPNEEVIKQRAKELADAQSAMTQLQALRQARVLQILTPEQRIKLREIHARNQELRRQQAAANRLRPPQQLKRNANALSLTPAQRRALRQQQKQKH